MAGRSIHCPIGVERHFEADPGNRALAAELAQALWRYAAGIAAQAAVARLGEPAGKRLLGSLGHADAHDVPGSIDDEKVRSHKTPHVDEAGRRSRPADGQRRLAS